MSNGKINLTASQIQGQLRQLMESMDHLTPEQRYSLTSAIETMEFIKCLSPGLQKALAEMKKGRKPANGHALAPVNGTNGHSVLGPKAL